MNIKNPMLWLVGYFVLANIADIVTSMFILPGEGNPLYLFTGSILLVYILKILIVGMVVWFIVSNKYPSHFIYFLFITILVYGSLLISLGVTSNVIGIMNPQLITQASTITAAEKARTYGLFTTIFYLIPSGLSLLAFKFYEWSISNVIIVKKRKGE